MEKLGDILKRKWGHLLRKRSLLCMAAFCSLFLYVVANSFWPYAAKVSADGFDGYTTVPYCSPNNMQSWDWPTALKGLSSQSGFDKDSSSYVIYGTNDTPVPGATFRTWFVRVAKGTNKIHLTEPGGPFTDEELYVDGDSTLYADHVHDWIVQGSSTSDTGAYYDATVIVPHSAPSSYTGAFGDQTCYVTAHNVVYDSDYSDQQYPTQPPGSTNTPTGSGGCSGLDVGCYISGLFSTVTDAFHDSAQAIVTGLANLFIPNTSAFSADWTSFQSTMRSHLGFLLWPFAFVGNVFTAMTTPTTTCSTSCTIGGGTIAGATVPGIDLAYPSQHLGTLWTYVQLGTQGLTILTLIFFIRHKFMEITAK